MLGVLLGAVCLRGRDLSVLLPLTNLLFPATLFPTAVAFQNLPSAENIGFIIPIVSGPQWAILPTPRHLAALLLRCARGGLSTLCAPVPLTPNPAPCLPPNPRPPQPVVDRFLAEVSRHGEYRGYCSLGLVFQVGGGCCVLVAGAGWGETGAAPSQLQHRLRRGVLSA